MVELDDNYYDFLDKLKAKEKELMKATPIDVKAIGKVVVMISLMTNIEILNG